MYISTCLAYENIEIKVESMEEHINLQFRAVKNDNSFSFTLSGLQVSVMVLALLETLMAMEEVQDPLQLFGSARRIRDVVETKQKEAA